MLTIIMGSNRKDSQSSKVAKYLLGQLKGAHQCAEIEMIDLRDLALPLFNDESFASHKAWPKISEMLKKSSAFVVVTPEWDGMACPTIKNFFNYCRSQELSHKPALIVTVSAGAGGSYPVVELRMSSYKNSRICYIPDHVVVRQVESLLNEESPVNADDTMIRERLDFSIKMLLCYEKAFKNITSEKFLYDPAYLNGM